MIEQESLNALVKRSQQGDTGAFSELMEKTTPYLFALAFRLLQHRQEAEDAVQETFYRIWKHLQSFDYRARFTTWAFRIVTNLCLDELKSKRRKTFKRAYQEEDPADPTDLERELEDKNMAREIQTIAETLSPKQRIVFVLRDLEDLPIHEVAAIARMSKESVKSNLYHARRAIRDRLCPKESLGGKRDAVS